MNLGWTEKKSKFIKKGSNSLFFIFIHMKSFLQILKETITQKKSNLDIVMDKFSQGLNEDELYILPILKNFIQNFIRKRGYNVRFLNACTSFQGVRTKDQIILCSPSMMHTLGDFIYTLFHEIRHEQQIKEIKMLNPLSEMDLDDFEKLYKAYWEMELDADQYGKNMLNQLSSRLGLPEERKNMIFKLSEFTKNYPQASDIIKNSLKNIVVGIQNLKNVGVDYEDIQDHPIVKPYLKNLESFI